MGTEDFTARLQAAVNAGDLDALVECFEPDYRNETPAHPGRGFEGREQVRTNWQRLFAGVPDLHAEVLRASMDGDAVWSEWEMRGTRPDGIPHLMRGVIIFGLRDGRAAWARFYLEPVDAGEGGVDAAIGRIVDPQRRP
jgi:ketosteroid isomerase-like protein